VKVERLDGNRFERTSYGDSLQLAWSALPDRSFAAIDLLENIPQYIDVISTRETSHTIHLHTHLLPFRYEDLFFTTTTYRVTVVVSGDGVSPASIALLFDWNGRWDFLPCLDQRGPEAAQARLTPPKPFPRRRLPLVP
jgi:hypothetical protein